MSAYVSIAWTSGTEWYYPTQRLLNEPTISMGVTLDGTMELPSITVSLDDGDGYFSGKVTGADADIVGKAMVVRWGSSTGTLLFTGYVTDLPDASAGVFSIAASMRAGGLEQPVGQSYSTAGGPPVSYPEFSEIRSTKRQVNEGRWFGPWIGKFSDSTTDGGLGTGNIPCWRYGHVTATGERFIVGQGGGSKAKDAVYNVAGANVTSVATLTTHAPGSTTYDSITYNSGNNKITANLTSTGDPTTVFDAAYGLGDIASLVTWQLLAATLQGMGYENDNIAIGNWERRTGIEFVQDMAKSFAHLPCIKETGVVYMRPLALNVASRYTADKAIARGLIDLTRWSQRIDYSRLIGRLDFSFWYHYAAAQFQRTAAVVAASGFTQEGVGEALLRFVRSPQLAYKVALRWFYLCHAPHVWYKLSIPLANEDTLTSFWSGMIGSVVSFNEAVGYYRDTTRYGQVYRATLNMQGNVVELDVLDLSALCAGFDDVRLLLRGSDLLHDTDDDDRVFDLSPTGQHEPVCTAVTRGTDGSLVFNGTSSFIEVADSADWDLFNSTNATIRFRIKFTNASAAAAEFICSQYVDATHLVAFSRRTSPANAIRFALNYGTPITATSASGAIADTNWHDIVISKAGDALGIYVDGAQVAFASVAGISGTLAAPFMVGQINGGSWFPGSINLVRITRDNCYGAAPVVGLTDNIAAATPAWNADLWK